VFAAPAIGRHIEYKTGICINQFVKMLRPLRSGIVTINGHEFLAEPEIPDTVKTMLNCLIRDTKMIKSGAIHGCDPIPIIGAGVCCLHSRLAKNVPFSAQ
jgi:hypothetical protein